MFVFYLDESGSPRPHRDPLNEGQTPLFVVASLVFHADRWRALDRAYRRLKVRFFQTEIGARRPEMYEVKSTELIGPHNRGSRRRHAFVRQAMDLCVEHQGRGFAVILKKNSAAPTSSTSMYTMALQYLVERFQCFLEETAQGRTPDIAECHAQGIIIADSRLNDLDLNVAISHNSFIFGNPEGLNCTRVIEAPTFTFSQLSVGVQLTDIFAGCIYARAYQRHCLGVGHAVNYAHMGYFGQFADRLEFRSQLQYGGYTRRGYRFIDLSEQPA